MKHIYHSSAFDPAIPVDSYWAASAPPLEIDTPALGGDETCEVAVIGSGYTGMSAALHLARDHGTDVRILERVAPGWGASGRNGGFCCLGGTKVSFATLIRRYGEAEARRFAMTQLEAIDLVRELSQGEGFDLDASGQGDILVAHDKGRVADLHEEQAFMRDVYGLDSRLYPQEELRQAGLAMAGAQGALHMPHGFGLHPLKYARGLAGATVARGVAIHANSPVEAWQKVDGWHRLSTPGGTLRARKVIVATNGYTAEDLHPGLTGRVLPVLSNIVTTRPLTVAEREAQGWTTPTMAYDSRRLLHYFRLLPDGRFMLGARGGVSASPQSVARMKANMRRRLARLFPAWADVEISHFWRGFVCLAADLVLHVGRLPDDPSVVHALAYHGNGVSMATWSGRAAARLTVGEGADGEIVPAVAGQPLPRFPLPGLRPLYLRGAYMAYRLQDEVL
ncbi:FAD-dependent oxidoreductase [Microbaculum marinum]|uniref:FAD-dependent oxidoreductase n=1 Tax=Microbaculum marinum TaxID=1764581 RepID=A0AAW9RSS4_9HYPH